VKVLISHDMAEADLERIRSVSDSLVVEKATTLEEALERAAEAEVVYAGRWSDELWRAAPNLKWVQSWGAGVERFLTRDFVASPIVLTNAAGIYAIPIAEHIMAFVLHFSRRFDRALRAQREARWDWVEPDELAGRTLGIVGLGGIGAEAARRAKALDMRVIGTRRRPELGGGYVDEVRGHEQLDWLLAEADYVALCTPLTPQTRRLIGAPQLARMKPTAYLINVGRGGLVDEAALVAALQERAIAGAGLDVFEQEPLPPESPLWGLPNVLITPHTAGGSPRSHERIMALFGENLRRFLAGEELLNVVDKREGY